MNFGTILCPLAEPLPPDLASAEGVETAGLSARLLEGEGGLRKGKAIKNRNTSEKYQPVPTRHYFQQKRRSATES